MLDRDGVLVSVVIPCFNGEAFLATAIGSALAQGIESLEVIAVDDGSTDGSPRIMESYGSRIKVVRQANHGLPAARNAGLKVCRGRYVSFLDCDDYWRPDFASTMLSALETSGAAIAYCGWQNVGLTGGRGDPFLPPDYEADPEKHVLLLSGVRWPVHAAMVRRDVVEDVGGFDSRWTSCEDFAFWLRAAMTRRLIRVPEVMAFYRHHDGVQMTKKRAQVARNFWLIQREYLRGDPKLRRELGDETIRRITHGALLARGYDCFWDRDLASSQAIFRTVMASGYGALRDWVYMLPALLPLPLYRWMIGWRDHVSATAGKGR